MSSVAYYWVSIISLVVIAASAAGGARALYLLVSVAADLASALDNVPPASGPRHAPAAVAAAAAAEREREFVEPPGRRDPTTAALYLPRNDEKERP